MGYIQLILFVGLAAIGFAAKHSYDNGKRAEGRAEMVPALVKATEQLDRDIVAFGEVAKAFAAIKANSERLKQLAAQAQKVKIVRQDVEKTRIEYIDRVVPTGTNECERTSDAIKKVLR